MNITDRDRKILTLIAPLALIAAFWFLAYAPKREESAAAQEALTQAQSEQQDAESQASSVSGAKANFASDYTTVIRLGKAIPSTVDMPSLIIQLDRAARGTDIEFDKIATGERQAAPAAAAAPSSGGTAQSGPGQAKEAAQNGAAQASGTGTLNGAQPAAGSEGSGAAGTSAPALETVPLDFTFKGTFFDLADFFHRMKRFVKVVNDDIVVRGRLLTIDSFNWKADPQDFPNIQAEVQATVFLAPKAQGVNAGANPTGPGATATPSSTPASGGSTPSSPATTAPAATVK